MKLMKHLMAALAAVTILSSAHAGTTLSGPGTPGNPFGSPGFTPEATSLWDDVSNSAHPSGYPGFPGLGSWTPMAPNSGTITATLDKLSDGVYGAPYPASQSIYHGGYLYLPNIPGGELILEETSPVTNGANDVKNISLQLQTGEALGADLYDEPVLTYTTGTGTYIADDPSYNLVSSFNNGDYEHDEEEVDPQDIIINTHRYRWDLGDVEEDILGFQITWQGTQHSQLYGLQLDQSTN